VEAEKGDTCKDPIALELGTEFHGDNSGLFGDSYAAAEKCGDPYDSGEGNPDMAFIFTPEETGIYTIHLESDVGSWPSLAYVTTDCEDMENACLGFQDFYAVWSAVSDLEVTMEKGVDYFIIVDADYTSDLGPFTLIVTGPGA